MPSNIINYIKNIDNSLLFNILKYEIISSNNLSIYLGVDEGIENKLKKEIYSAKDINELIHKWPAVFPIL